jgi:hypothetical protein
MKSEGEILSDSSSCWGSEKTKKYPVGFAKTYERYPKPTTQPKSSKARKTGVDELCRRIPGLAC